MAEAGHNSSGYTIKEMLDKIVIPTLESIDSRLDTKADRATVEVLQGRVSEVERVMVRRDGPLAQDLNAVVRKVAVIDAETEHRIDERLKAYTTTNAASADRIFSRRDRMVLAVLGIVTTACSIIATIVLLAHLGGHHS